MDQRGILTQGEYNDIIKIDNIKIDNIIDNIKIDNVKEGTSEVEHTAEEPEEINIDDYEIPEDEREYIPYVEILNVYNVYFKSLYNKKEDGTLLDDIDQNDPSSTNRAMEKLYDEIHKYKSAGSEMFTKLYDPTEYRKVHMGSGKLPEDYPFYMVNIKGEQKVTHNLITALMYVASSSWQEEEWSINQVNEF
jgi:hypothetical protein